MEVAIAIAVVAILAGTAIPLVLKSVNQAKEQRARSDMKVAWEALFGAQDRAVANMRSDFGFNPGLAAGTSVNLAKLTTRTAAPAPNPPVFGANGAPFNWGWNGPYWFGATRTIGGNPVPSDPWNNPYLLRFVTGSGYQIICTGADGVLNTAGNAAQPAGDDFVYPVTPLNLATQVSQIVVTIQNNRAAAVTATLTLRNRVTAGANVIFAVAATSTPVVVNSGLSGSYTFSNVLPGGGTLQVSVPAAGVNFTESFTLASGETRNLRYIMN
jgi:type II secretory pathway pseudopilin PulG